MITEKLFDNKPYLREFSANVRSCVPAGKRWTVVLDRTAFYPEGGGQPCDLGMLGGAQVVDVQESDGIILHTVTAPLEGRVDGCIDWDRRFDLMQQHSGEHIVSGIVHRLYGWENVGFHMGSDVITIDFSGPLDWDDLAKVERMASETVWADRETLVRRYESEAACPEDYRSKKAISGPLRLVEFPGADVCACCGTHVARAGEIGVIKLLSVVRFHQGVRVELVCGRRAYEYLAAVTAQNRAVSGLLSAKPFETAKAVERTAKELETVRYERGTWENRWLAARAAACRGAGDLLLFEDELSPDSLRKLCAEILEVCGGRCAVFSGSDRDGYAYAIGQAGGDLRAFVKEMNAALNGRGGGKPGFAQGRVGAARTAIEEYFTK